jgi:hypothetical protein
LGVEIWLPTTPCPTIPAPIFYTFESRQLPHERLTDFVQRASREASDYISTFEWDPADANYQGAVPYFNLTFDDPD